MGVDSSSAASPPGLEALAGGPARAAYASTRRVFRIIDRVSRDGAQLTVRDLADDLGISISTCYHLLSVLVDEGYVVKLPRHAGYGLGPTIAVLHGRERGSTDAVIDPALRRLALRAQCGAYFGVLAEHDSVLVTHAHLPADSAPVGVPAGFRGPAHALALGKVLVASGGIGAIDRYIQTHTLEAYTRRTITEPSKLEAHLKAVRARGFATEFEEFAKNLYGVAVPVTAATSGPSGAIALATVAGTPAGDLKRLIRLAQSTAADVAAAL
jgi:IclR family acetate operon transcriptional repressor